MLILVPLYRAPKSEKGGITATTLTCSGMQKILAEVNQGPSQCSASLLEHLSVGQSTGFHPGKGGGGLRVTPVQPLGLDQPGA